LASVGRGRRVHPLSDLASSDSELSAHSLAEVQPSVSSGWNVVTKLRPKPKFVKKPDGMFADLVKAPPDPILGTTIAFKEDPAPEKINLGVGAYRTEEGKPYILPVVLQAESELFSEATDGEVDKEYTTIDGPAALKTMTQKLILGEDAESVEDGRVASVQALSGTGALRVVAEFIKRKLPAASHTVWISDPTWGNHLTIFKEAGFTVKTYQYWDEATKGLSFDKMMSALEKAEPGQILLLHPCAHNPTGVDPTPDQWQQILDLCKRKELIPLMDSAYQGYASGDLDRDAYSIRLFEQAGMEMFVCQSFAKNLGLYGERIGMLHVVCQDQARAEAVLSQMKLIIRPMYSSPPIHGAQLVMKILGSAEMFQQWKAELKEMAERIHKMRSDLQSGLESMGTPGTWKHITQQIGMFSFTGLTPAQCERLIAEHHIYLLKSGRISMAGLNEGNIQKMITSVDEVVRACP